MPRLRLVAASAVLALVVVGTVGAAGTQLNGSVGPGVKVSLKDGSGARATPNDWAEGTPAQDNGATRDSPVRDQNRVRPRQAR